MRISLRAVFVSPFTLVVLGVCVVLIGISAGQEFMRRYALQQQIDTLQQQVGSLQQENQQFSELLTYLETKNFTEEEARLQLGLRQPGEEVVVIEQPAESTLNSAVDPLANASNAQKWLVYFFQPPTAPLATAPPAPLP